MKTAFSLLLGSLLLVRFAGGAVVVPDRIAPAVPDRQAMQSPEAVHFTGWLGSRIAGTESNRLVKIDPERLLEGYRHRPGRQTWDGEHVGKWLHAATLAWVHTHDVKLREKLDATVKALAECQLEDGYLGTYTADQRWTSWDVWAHKYNLLGLITYVRYTGDQAPLTTCRRMADLLCRTFGDGPGQRDIIPAGEHVGMAPTSVLEPMALLYRLTGEKRYLDFCHYLVRAWEQPNGPKIMSRLLAGRGVNEVGNGKAYEMLSCLNGAAELYRTTGDARLLQACEQAWKDIVAKRLYLTGAASYRELFRSDYDLPNTNSVGETCVTVTWLQLNAQLLRLTGEARFAEEIERVTLNQLLGAESPDCSGWGYYVQLQGQKPYSSSLDGHCCLSSGPRGIALIPTFALTSDSSGVVVNLYEAGTAKVARPDGDVAELTVATNFPADGKVTLTVRPGGSPHFTVKLRLPRWSDHTVVRVNGADVPTKPGDDGYLALTRIWQAGDRIDIAFSIEPRLQMGDHSNEGHAAVLYGPLVLAADEAYLPEDVTNLSVVSLASTDVPSLAPAIEESPGPLRTWPGARVLRIDADVRRTNGMNPSTVRRRIGLVPFADAGATGRRYAVWLPTAPARTTNLLLDGAPLADVAGGGAVGVPLLNDGDLHTMSVLSTAAAPQPLCAGVTLARPAAIHRVSFVHGSSWGDGGWFDSSRAKPVLQIQRPGSVAWETVAEFADYPATTAENGGEVLRYQVTDLRMTNAEVAAAYRRNTFTVTLPVAETVIAVRLMGYPSRGNHPTTYSLMLAELTAAAN